jgi:hypothetical protein
MSNQVRKKPRITWKEGNECWCSAEKLLTDEQGLSAFGSEWKGEILKGKLVKRATDGNKWEIQWEVKMQTVMIPKGARALHSSVQAARESISVGQEVSTAFVAESASQDTIYRAFQIGDTAVAIVGDVLDSNLLNQHRVTKHKCII